MATPLDPKQVISFEELLMSHVVQQGALTRLLVEKGIFTREEFLEMVRVVDLSRNHDPVSVIEWAEAYKIRVLNVAGPGESKTPRIYGKAVEFLRGIFTRKELLEMAIG